MELNINDLSKLKGSDDFECIRKILIELKNNNFKAYCDGFTMSYRNGLYYKNYNNLYSTDYTNQDYINFLINKTDNQINHELIRCLGPLKYKNIQ